MEAFESWPPGAPRALIDGAVDVFGARVSALREDYDRFEALLSEREHGRAERFRFERDRVAYVVAHGILHEIIGAAIGLDPADVSFEVDGSGRPSLPTEENEAAVDFNLSHSGDAIAVAIGAGMRVGVDVERIARPVDYQRLSTRFFSEAEAADVSMGGRAIFFDKWAKKEAVAKAIGAGISMSLKSFSVTPESEQLVAVDGHGTWFVTNVEPGGGYVSAVAVDSKVEVRRWS